MKRMADKAKFIGRQSSQLSELRRAKNSRVWGFQGVSFKAVRHLFGFGMDLLRLGEHVDRIGSVAVPVSVCQHTILCTYETGKAGILQDIHEPHTSETNFPCHRCFLEGSFSGLTYFQLAELITPCPS